MKKVIFPVARVLMGVLFVLTITVGVAPADNPGPNEVILYEHVNYDANGKSIRFSVGTNVPNLTNNKLGRWNWNDKVSSIRVGLNVRLLAWEHKDYRGKCMTFSGLNAGGQGNYNDLRRWRYNDIITSLKVRHPEDPDSVCPSNID